MARTDTGTAMREMIAEIRRILPFDVPEARVCDGPCEGCSLKLLDYLESELEGWEARLAAGEKPGLGDLSRLGRSARKVYRVMERNGLVGEEKTAGPD